MIALPFWYIEIYQIDNKVWNMYDDEMEIPSLNFNEISYLLGDLQKLKTQKVANIYFLFIQKMYYILPGDI